MTPNGVTVWRSPVSLFQHHRCFFSLTPGWAALSKNGRQDARRTTKDENAKHEARMHHASGHMVSLLGMVAGGEISRLLKTWGRVRPDRPNDQLRKNR